MSQLYLSWQKQLLYFQKTPNVNVYSGFMKMHFAIQKYTFFLYKFLKVEICRKKIQK